MRRQSSFPYATASRGLRAGSRGSSRQPGTWPVASARIGRRPQARDSSPQSSSLRQGWPRLGLRWAVFSRYQVSRSPQVTGLPSRGAPAAAMAHWARGPSGLSVSSAASSAHLSGQRRFITAGASFLNGSISLSSISPANRVSTRAFSARRLTGGCGVGRPLVAGGIGMGPRWPFAVWPGIVLPGAPAHRRLVRRLSPS